MGFPGRSRGSDNGVIPSEYEPEKDVLFITTYLGRDGNPRADTPALMWRGKPFEPD